MTQRSCCRATKDAGAPVRDLPPSGGRRVTVIRCAGPPSWCGRDDAVECLAISSVAQVAGGDLLVVLSGAGARGPDPGPAGFPRCPRGTRGPGACASPARARPSRRCAAEVSMARRCAVATSRTSTGAKPRLGTAGISRLSSRLTTATLVPADGCWIGPRARPGLSATSSSDWCSAANRHDARCARPHDPRLRPLRHHQSVRRPGHRHRQGHRPAPAPPSSPGVPAVPQGRSVTEAVVS